MLLMNRRTIALTDVGFNVHCRTGSVRWLPAGGQEGSEVVLIGHRRDAFEHVGDSRYSTHAI
jgi:hypothetical protein